MAVNHVKHSHNNHTSNTPEIITMREPKANAANSPSNNTETRVMCIDHNTPLMKTIDKSNLCWMCLTSSQISWNCTKFHDGSSVCNDCYLQINNFLFQENKIDRDLHCDHICDGNVLRCSCLNAIQIVQTEYNYAILNNNEIDTGAIYNAFLHLLEEHDTHNDFEAIYKSLGGSCDISMCCKFKRNHRNRSNFNVYKECNNDCVLITKIQILDSIHCYYSHCFDIGNRFNKVNATDQKMMDDDHNHNHNQKILKSKHKMYRKHRKNKFMLQPQHEKKEYSFGFQFSYDGEEGIKIHSKRDSFKQELLHNAIFTLCTLQFDCEYKKAQQKWKSVYGRKLHFALYKNHYKEQTAISVQGEGPYDAFGNFGSALTSSTKKLHQKILSLEHLLSVMIYCNYTSLQYEFSKTFRRMSDSDEIENVAIRHSNFYWFGKLLKEMVNFCGRDCMDGSVQSLYHGITEQLSMPHIIPCYIRIFCPLSTTTELAVGCNFADDKGLIIEFGCHESSNNMNCSKRYFSCTWLSDFGNEHEHLFIQHSENIAIVNITDTRSGTHFMSILKAIHVLDFALHSTHVPHAMKKLVMALVHDRLSCKMQRFQSLDNLHPYARSLFNTFCDTKINISFDICEWQSKCWYLFDLFFNNKWINWDVLDIVYPNLSYIYVNNVSFSERILSDVWQRFGSSSMLTRLELNDPNNTSIPECSLITKYKKLFEGEMKCNFQFKTGQRSMPGRHWCKLIINRNTT
eukprot:146029_1